MKQLQIVKQITNRENESLDRYFSEISKFELISVEAEVALTQRIREGDAIALEKLTKANLRFVVSVAKQYQHKGLSLSDLINEGNLGLIKAAQRFDETRGFKFISYAVWWIRQCILQALAEHVRIVRLPLNRVAAYHKMSKSLTELEQKFQREPSADEVAEAVGFSAKVVNEILINPGRGVSMDAPFKSGEELTLLDVISDADNVMPDTWLLKDSLETEITRIITALSPREALVISMYFGLKGEKPKKLEEIGEELNLTRERVRQIRERAIKTLRKASRKTTLNTFL